jgi:hypothetical protein
MGGVRCGWMAYEGGKLAGEGRRLWRVLGFLLHMLPPPEFRNNL